MANWIDPNMELTKGAAEQASNAELAAKYRSLMQDQAIGKHVDSMAAQAYTVGAQHGVQQGVESTLAKLLGGVPAIDDMSMVARRYEDGLAGRHAPAQDTRYYQAMQASGNTQQPR